MKSLLVVKSYFRKYYEAFGDTIYVKDPIEREFMFMSFDGKVRRHFTFKDNKSLRDGLVREAPRHAYYSVSLYENPSAPMEEKGLKRSDVLFDIDATELEGCGREDIWVCERCGTYGSGEKPEKCPKCGSSEVKVLRWLDEECMAAAKEELRKLIRLLRDDFGLREEDLILSYTGNRGFHVRITSEKYSKLSKDARRELALYVIGSGADVRLWMRRIGNLYVFYPPSGQAKRAIENLPNLLSDNIRLKRKVLDMIKGKPARLNKRELSIISSAVKRSLHEVSPEIDWMVTMDTSRFTRIPNSLHGKTGFRALLLTLSDVEEFDPFRSSPIPITDELELRVKYPIPKFRVHRSIVGPFSEGERLSLPANAAIFLILSGRAEIL